MHRPQVTVRNPLDARNDQPIKRKETVGRALMKGFLLPERNSRASIIIGL